MKRLMHIIAPGLDPSSTSSSETEERSSDNTDEASEARVSPDASHAPPPESASFSRKDTDEHRVANAPTGRQKKYYDADFITNEAPAGTAAAGTASQPGRFKHVEMMRPHNDSPPRAAQARTPTPRAGTVREERELLRALYAREEQDEDNDPPRGLATPRTPTAISVTPHTPFHGDTTPDERDILRTYYERELLRGQTNDCSDRSDRGHGREPGGAELRKSTPHARPHLSIRIDPPSPTAAAPPLITSPPTDSSQHKLASSSRGGATPRSQPTGELLLQVERLYQTFQSLRFCHDFSAKICASRGRVVAFPSRMLQGLVGSGSAVSLIMAYNNMTVSEIVINIITIMGSVLSTIDSFSDFTSREERHSLYRSRLDEILADIEQRRATRRIDESYLSEITLKSLNITNNGAPAFVGGSERRLSTELKEQKTTTVRGGPDDEVFQRPGLLRTLKSTFGAVMSSPRPPRVKKDDDGFAESPVRGAGVGSGDSF